MCIRDSHRRRFTERLRWPVHATDVPSRGRAEPDEHVRSVGQTRVVLADLLPRFAPHDGLGAHDHIATGAGLAGEPLLPVPHGPVSNLLGDFVWMVDETRREAVDEADVRAALHQRDGPRDGVAWKGVVRGEQDDVVAFGQLQACLLYTSP